MIQSDLQSSQATIQGRYNNMDVDYWTKDNQGAADDINVIRRRAARDGKGAAMEITAGDVTTDFIIDE